MDTQTQSEDSVCDGGLEKTSKFWESHFSQAKEEYDWLLSYGEMKEALGWSHGANTPVIPKIERSDQVLIVGCGLGRVGPDMVADGHDPTMIVNADIATSAVEQMSARYPAMNWTVSDATSMPEFGDGTFDCVIDKGTSDTFHFRTKDNMTRRMFGEVSRVLRNGGRYFVVSPRDRTLRRDLESEEYGWSVNRVGSQESSEAFVQTEAGSRTSRPIYIHLCVKGEPLEVPKKNEISDVKVASRDQLKQLSALISTCDDFREAVTRVLTPSEWLTKYGTLQGQVGPLENMCAVRGQVCSKRSSGKKLAFMDLVQPDHSDEQPVQTVIDWKYMDDVRIRSQCGSEDATISRKDVYGMAFPVRVGDTVIVIGHAGISKHNQPTHYAIALWMLD